MTVFFLSKWK